MQLKLLNRPSWLLGKWKLVSIFLEKAYRANAWMDKLDLRNPTDFERVLIDSGVDLKFILWF